MDKSLIENQIRLFRLYPTPQLKFGSQDLDEWIFTPKYVHLRQSSQDAFPQIQSAKIKFGKILKAAFSNNKNRKDLYVPQSGSKYKKNCWLLVNDEQAAKHKNRCGNPVLIDYFEKNFSEYKEGFQSKG